MKKYFLFIFICLNISLFSQDNILRTNNSKISFISEAPLETITAKSKALSGVLNKKNNTFSFKVRMKSFDGFNSPLQQEHFLENYMEVDQFPDASFSGKVIEPIVDGKGHQYRAKGMLSIHGIEKEVIIILFLDVFGNKIDFKSKFEVLLEDFEIRIPRLVNQKIANTIQVFVDGSMINMK